ncbi:MAG: hypothetical protein WA736_18995, partial [Candidatus Acidiferrum sp.]
AQPGQGDDSVLEKRVEAYEEACILSLRTINTAEATYRGGDEIKGFARTLGELGPKRAGILEPIIASGKKDGYRFRLTPEPTAPDRAVQHYTVIAQPLKRLIKNQRSFFTDETGVIRFTTENRPATSSDAALDLSSH